MCSYACVDGCAGSFHFKLAVCYDARIYHLFLALLTSAAARCHNSSCSCLCVSRVSSFFWYVAFSKRSRLHQEKCILSSSLGKFGFSFEHQVSLTDGRQLGCVVSHQYLHRLYSSSERSCACAPTPCTFAMQDPTAKGHNQQ